MARLVPGWPGIPKLNEWGRDLLFGMYHSTPYTSLHLSNIMEAIPFSRLLSLVFQYF